MDRWVDQPGFAVDSEQDVAPPEVAVHEGGSPRREQLVELGHRGAHDIVEPTTRRQEAEAGTVEPGAVGPPRGIHAAITDPRGAPTPVRERGAVQPCQRAPEELLVGRRPWGLVDRHRHQEVLLRQHDVGHRRSTHHTVQLSQPVTLVESARTDLDDQSAAGCLHQPGAGSERARRSGRADGARKPCQPRCRRGHRAMMAQ